jgi:hypothetical protein
MKRLNFLSWITKLMVLTFCLLLSQAIASFLSGANTGTETATFLPVVFLVSLAQATVLNYLVVRSRYRGWKLYLATFTVFFGIATALSQAETLVFLRYLVSVVPATMVPRFFLQGFLTALIFSFFLLAIHGKLLEKELPTKVASASVSQKRVFAKLLALALLYVGIYLSFGLFVFRPLAAQAFQEFYAGLSLPAWILPFQVLRGLAFAALALLITKVTRGKRWEKALLSALLFSVLMGFLLLLPNPYLPPSIRNAHFVEVTSSNFLFGWLAGWWLGNRE